MYMFDKLIAMPDISCNHCACSVDGIAYRTVCKHFFCPPCAKKSFQNDSYCPICRSCLAAGDVVEVNIGISNISLIDVVFQNALQNTSWEKIMENINKSSLAVAEVSQFMIEQLYFQSLHNNDDRNKLLNEVQMQNAQMARLNDKIIALEHQNSQAYRGYESQLSVKNKELLELQEAYKEKLRKCQAWEKAYNNVRGQLTNKSGLDGGPMGSGEAQQIVNFQRQQPAFYAAVPSTAGSNRGLTSAVGRMSATPSGGGYPSASGHVYHTLTSNESANPARYLSTLYANQYTEGSNSALVPYYGANNSGTGAAQPNVLSQTIRKQTEYHTTSDRDADNDPRNQDSRYFKSLPPPIQHSMPPPPSVSTAQYQQAHQKPQPGVLYSGAPAVGVSPPQPHTQQQQQQQQPQQQYVQQPRLPAPQSGPKMYTKPQQQPLQSVQQARPRPDFGVENDTKRHKPSFFDN